MQPPFSMRTPRWHSPLPWYPRVRSLEWPQDCQGEGEHQQGIYMWGKRRRRLECAPEGKDWLSGNHRDIWTYSWWCMNLYVFLEVIKTKGPWLNHLYFLPYQGFRGGVKTSQRFGIGDKIFVNTARLFHKVDRMFFQSLCITQMGCLEWAQVVCACSGCPALWSIDV